MSKVISVDGKRVFAIEKEEAAKCEYCGKIAELRPYGRNGANICYACGMKNESETRAMTRAVLESCDAATIEVGTLKRLMEGDESDVRNSGRPLQPN